MSEALALRGSDKNWLASSLGVKRGIVEQNVDEVKTENSAKTFVLAGELLAIESVETARAPLGT